MNTGGDVRETISARGHGNARDHVRTTLILSSAAGKPVGAVLGSVTPEGAGPQAVEPA
ncbi:MAG: hypothetical protein V1912_01405 [bacterium]